MEEPLHRAHPVIAQGVPDVVHALGDVDVEAGQPAVRLHHLREGAVGDRKEGVAAEHGFDHVVVLFGRPPGEFGIFPDRLPAFFFAVPLRDLIAQTGADAQLLRRVPDRKKRARDLREARVVIENGGHAVPDAVEDRGVGAGLRAVERQVPVDVPPGAVEDLEEIRGIIALDGKASCQAGVDVGMGVDEAGHDHPALRVHELRVRVCGLQVRAGPDRKDLLPLYRHRAVRKIRQFRISGDHASVSDDEHLLLLLCNSPGWSIIF